MKKIKLLLAAMAAMVTMGVNAQDWIASEVGAGNFHLYNVGKGQFLTRGNGWGTQASTGANALTLIVEEYDGAYKLRTNINGSGKGLERLSDPVIYTDQSNGKNSTWTFTKVADGSNGPIYTIVSKDNHGGGAGSFMTASADNTIVGPADAVTDDYGRWQLVQAWVTNSMPVSDASGWTTSQSPTFDGGNICAEYWNKSGATIKQTVSNLPAGSYELIAVAFTRSGMTATLNAGSNTMSIATASTDEANNRGQANTWFNNGNGVNKLEFTHAGGNLEIGLTADNTTGDHWLVWRSFILLYKGLDLSELKAALQAQIDAVPALEGTTTAAAYNAAKNYADGINMDALTTEEAISTASTELSALVATATVLQTTYARYQSIKTAAKAWETQTSVYTGDAIVDTDAADTEVEAATTVEGINAAIATLRSAAATFLGAVTINENQCFNITSVFLDNADFSAGNIDGWETNYVSGQQAQNIGYQGASYTNEDVTISKFIEAWKPGAELGDGYLRQTVANLPEGKFVLEADAIATWQNDDSRVITGAQLYITADGVDYKYDMSTKNGKPQHFSTEFMNTGEGNVIFGLRTVSANCNWLCADNFTVKFYGIDLAPYATNLANAVAEAEAVDQTTLNTGAKDALNSALETYNKSWSTSKEYATAISAIQTATNNALAIPAALAEFTQCGVTIAALKDVEGYTETVDGATTTFTTTLGAAALAADAATTVAEVEVLTDAVKAAGMTFLASVRSDGAHPFDITFLIENPGFDDNNINGWTRTFDGGTANTRCHSNEFYNNNSFDFYQTLTDMPKGNYELKVRAFQRPGDAGTAYNAYSAGNTSTDAVVYINDGETAVKHIAAEAQNEAIYWENNGNYPDDSRVGSEGAYKFIPFSMEGAEVWFAAGHYDNSILTAVEGTLKLGFKADHKTADGTWTLFDDFRLYFYGQSINVAMSEAEAFTALADIEGANVTMVRNTVADFNTVALPFDLDVAQTKAVFGDDAVVYAFSEESTNPDDATINFTSTDTKIDANVPVLVKATKTATEIKVDNVTIKAGEAKVEGTNFDFVGNYGGKVTIAAEDWFISGGKLYQSTGATMIKGFRAYIKDKTNGQASVKLFIDGVATAISEVNGMAAEDGAIYNIAGQRVNNAQKGIFIVNGKKVVK